MEYLYLFFLFFVSSKVITFTQVTKEELGIESISGSPSWVDYNQDGLLDFYAGIAYINDGSGKFTKLSTSSWDGGRILSFGDYDNDGYPDIVTTKGGGPDTTFIVVYHNNGPPDFRLINVSEEAGLGTPIIERNLNDIAWLDYDNDGHLEFYISSYEHPFPVGHEDYLFHNRGAGTFEDLSTIAGIDGPELCSRGISCADFDNDGDMDIFVSVYRLQPNLLWQNNGNGTFTDVAEEKEVIGLYISGYYGHNIGAAWGDFNNDGYLDLFSPITHHSGYPGDSTSHLWVNNGPPEYDFTDIFATTGMLNCEIGSAPSWADYDNDGDLDLYFTNLYGSPGAQGWLYRNNGDETFTDVTSEAGLKHYRRKDYALWGDFNHDGFLDVYIPGDYTGNFFINKRNGNHWFEIDLKGVQSNKSAIGTRILAYAGSLLVAREVAPNGGHGYGSPFVSRQQFGLGSTERIDSLEIRWPSGLVEKVTDIPVNLRMMRTEGGPWIRDTKVFPLNVSVSDTVIITTFSFAHEGITSVIAEIESPDEVVIDSVELYDDGVHNDSAAGDSVYGNIWIVPSNGKTYLIDITAKDNFSNTTIVYNVGRFSTLGPVVIADWEIVGEDTVISPRDSVKLKIYVKNESLYPVFGIKGKFSTDNPYISICTRELDFGNIEGGETISDSNFIIKISEFPASESVLINVIFRDSLIPPVEWIDSFNILIKDDVPPFIHYPQVLPNFLASGEDVIVRTKLIDGSGILCAESYIESPPGSLITILPLYDDGVHNDSLAGDNIFGNIWQTPLNEEKFYNINIYVQDSIGNEKEYINLLEFTTKPFMVSSDILVVDDDNYNRPPIGNHKFYETYYTDALDAIGYSYDVWDVFCYGSPDTSILNRYTIVIWLTGTTYGDISYPDEYYNSPSLTEEEQIRVLHYIYAGGRLFLSGQGISDCKTILPHWLGIQKMIPDVEIDTVLGISDNPIGDRLDFAIKNGTGASNQFIQSAIVKNLYADTVFNYKDYEEQGCAGIMTEYREWRAVTFPFGFEAIDSEETRNVVMHRVIEWLYLVGIDTKMDTVLPIRYSLSRNFPNPFSRTTEIRYAIPKKSPVKLLIYNIAGQKVITLVNKIEKPGYKRIVWDGKDDSGRKVATGIYFYKLEIGNFSKTKKMTLVK